MMLGVIGDKSNSSVMLGGWNAVFTQSGRLEYLECSLEKEFEK